MGGYKMSMDLVLERLDQLTRVVERMDGRLQRVEDRLQHVEDGMAALTARVDIIKETVDSMADSLTDVKTLLQYHEDKWLDHDKEIWRLKRKA